jgi:hypothetical protein
MQREFGKRTIVRPPPGPAAVEPTSVPAKPPVGKQVDMSKTILAIVLTVVVVGGMFLLPRLAQCEAGSGALGLDWCQLMKASVEGAVRGVAAGRGASSR